MEQDPRDEITEEMERARKSTDRVPVEEPTWRTKYGIPVAIGIVGLGAVAGVYAGANAIFGDDGSGQPDRPERAIPGPAGASFDEIYRGVAARNPSASLVSQRVGLDKLDDPDQRSTLSLDRYEMSAAACADSAGATYEAKTVPFLVFRPYPKPGPNNAYTPLVPTTKHLEELGKLRESYLNRYIDSGRIKPITPNLQRAEVSNVSSLLMRAACGPNGARLVDPYISSQTTIIEASDKNPTPGLSDGAKAGLAILAGGALIAWLISTGVVRVPKTRRIRIRQSAPKETSSEIEIEEETPVIREKDTF